MVEFIWNKSVYSKFNGDFIYITAYSGYSLELFDPKSTQFYHRPDTDLRVLGESILQSLSESRFLSISESEELNLETPSNYLKWIEEVMTSYGYKNKRIMFKNMISCGIERKDEIIVFRPSYHNRLEGWGGTGRQGADHIKIPADSPPEKIGEALWEAFKRCTGPRPDCLGDEID